MVVLYHINILYFCYLSITLSTCLNTKENKTASKANFLKEIYQYSKIQDGGVISHTENKTDTDKNGVTKPETKQYQFTPKSKNIIENNVTYIDTNLKSLGINTSSQACSDCNTNVTKSAKLVARKSDADAEIWSFLEDEIKKDVDFLNIWAERTKDNGIKEELTTGVVITIYQETMSRNIKSVHDANLSKKEKLNTTVSSSFKYLINVLKHFKDKSDESGKEEIGIFEHYICNKMKKIQRSMCRRFDFCVNSVSLSFLSVLMVLQSSPEEKMIKFTEALSEEVNSTSVTENQSIYPEVLEKCIKSILHFCKQTFAAIQANLMTICFELLTTMVPVDDAKAPEPQDRQRNAFKRVMEQYNKMLATNESYAVWRGIEKGFTDWTSDKSDEFKPYVKNMVSFFLQIGDPSLNISKSQLGGFNDMVDSLFTFPADYFPLRGFRIHSPKPEHKTLDTVLRFTRLESQ